MSTATGPGHYGEWISAHLDGELSRAQDARLQVHLLQCAACAEALAAEQEARSLLLAATEAEPSAALTQRLLALACQDEAGQEGQPAGRERHGAGAAAGRRQRPAELRTLRPGESPTFPALTGDLRARRSVVAAVVVGAVGLGLGAGGLAALGAPPRVVPSAHRAEALTTLARTVGSGRVATAGLGGNVGVVSATDPAASDPTLAALRDEGWYVPRLVEGAQVVAHRVDGEGRLELEVATTEGALVLREQVGRLDIDALSGATVLEAGGRTLYVLSQSPWHVTWQSGDLVLEAYCAESNPLAESIVAAPGAEAPAPVAMGRRIMRGWQSITTVVSGR